MGQKLMPTGIDVVNMLAMTPFDMISVDGYMWFSAVGFNGLCRLNPKSGETVIMGCFLEEKWNAEFLHSQVKSYQKKLVFAPNRSGGIDIYDVEKRKFERVELPRVNMHNNATKIYAMHQSGNKFILFGLFMPSILFFDVLSGKIEYMQDMYERLYGSVYASTLPVFRKSSCQVGNSVYVLCAQSSAILQINILDRSYMFGNQDGLRFDTICYDGDFFWLSSQNDIYLMKNWKFKKIISVDKKYRFSISKCIGNYIYYIPTQPDDQETIIVIDKNNSSAVVELSAECDEDILRADDGANKVFNGICMDNRESAVLICGKSNKIFFAKNGKIEKNIHFFLESGIREMPELKEKIREALFTLSGFKSQMEKNVRLGLAYLLLAEENTDRKKNEQACVGYKIYQELLKACEGIDEK